MTYDSVESYERHNHIKHKYYIPVYKCLMCGQVVKNEEDEQREDEARTHLGCMLSSTMLQTGYGYCFRDRDDCVVHCCENGNFGVGHLIGMEFYKER